MTPVLEVTEVADVSPDVCVCHYDELTGDAKHAFPEAVVLGRATVPEPIAEQFTACDVVKFTSYYRVTIDRQRPGDQYSVMASLPRTPELLGVDRNRPPHGPLSE